MELLATTTFVLLLCIGAELDPTAAATTAGTADGKQKWGYADVRPKAHMFWWWHQSPQQVSSPGKPWPTILWLQGGLGESGTGRGNFLEIGPLDENLNPRPSTWLNKANLIFVDSPVGAGFSYVDDPSALAKTDVQAASDVIELIRALTKEIPTLHSSPLFVVGSFYGGKHAAMVGVGLARAIKAGSLKLTLGGVVLGDSWISPDDFALSYPPLLYTVSRLDDNAVGKATRMAKTVKEQMAAQQFPAAYKSWADLLEFINERSGNVNMDNFMIDNTISPVLLYLAGSVPSSPGSSQATAVPGASSIISSLMNGIIRRKLIIVPKHVIWKDFAGDVFDALTKDFMKPVVNQVDELLTDGVNVTLYNGQLDIICSTTGAQAWLKKLKWDGIPNFFSLPRKTLSYCHPEVEAFVATYKNFNFYWVLEAGRMVPVDQPCATMHVISTIVQSPATEEN